MQSLPPKQQALGALDLDVGGKGLNLQRAQWFFILLAMFTPGHLIQLTGCIARIGSAFPKVNILTLASTIVPRSFLQYLPGRKRSCCCLRSRHMRLRSTSKSKSKRYSHVRLALVATFASLRAPDLPESVSSSALPNLCESFQQAQPPGQSAHVIQGVAWQANRSACQPD